MKIKNYIISAILILSIFPLLSSPIIAHAEVDDSKWVNLTQKQKDWLKNSAQMSQNVASEKGVYSSIQIAQAIIESGWGQSGLARENHNLFGIKGDYQGQSSDWATQEDVGGGSMITITAPFRKYPSDKESYQDNADLLLSQGGTNSKVSSKELKGEEGKIYSCAWKKYADSYTKASKCLEGSYATDTTYSSKLNGMIEAYNLTQFDVKGSGDTGSDSKSEDTVEQSKFVGEDAWKNKMINFQNQVYKSTFKGIDTGSTGFVNSAFISSLNKTSQQVLNYAYIGMMIITIGLFFFMFLATVIYLVVLPNGIGGYKMMDIFEKTTGLSATVNRQTTIDIISRLLLTTLVIACLYANVLPMLISSVISIVRYLIGIF